MRCCHASQALRFLSYWVLGHCSCTMRHKMQVYTHKTHTCTQRESERERHLYGLFSVLSAFTAFTDIDIYWLHWFNYWLACCIWWMVSVLTSSLAARSGIIILSIIPDFENTLLSSVSLSYRDTCESSVIVSGCMTTI